MRYATNKELQKVIQDLDIKIKKLETKNLILEAKLDKILVPKFKNT